MVGENLQFGQILSLMSKGRGDQVHKSKQLSVLQINGTEIFFSGGKLVPLIQTPILGHHHHIHKIDAL